MQSADIGSDELDLTQQGHSASPQLSFKHGFKQPIGGSECSPHEEMSIPEVTVLPISQI